MSNLDLTSPLIVGFGVTGQAVAAALASRGHRPTVIDDRPSDAALAAAQQVGVELIAAPDAEELQTAVASVTVVLPSPGVPDHHPVFAAAVSTSRPIASEFDLAAAWDDRPLVAITGTNGKTTVTMMVTDALNRSGLVATAVGNTEVPLVSAIDDPRVNVFVVECSSFRLAHSQRFAPAVATWLNFSPDHLDAHATLNDYEQAKASIWAHLDGSSTAIVNSDDAIVAKHAPRVGSVVTFGSGQSDWTVGPETLSGPDFSIEVASLPRRQPHDLANAAAAAATARAGGASNDAIREMLTTFVGLPHRVEFIGEHEGVRWYNDSKATVPHATLAAVGGFPSVVLIAGGKNKGLDLSDLAQAVPPVRAVVATGDAADEVATVFGDAVPVHRADSMSKAIDEAASLATSGDVVLLSPACTSFDWYPNYKARGDDFRSLVTSRFSMKKDIDA